MVQNTIREYERYVIAVDFNAYRDAGILVTKGRDNLYRIATFTSLDSLEKYIMEILPEDDHDYADLQLYNKIKALIIPFVDKSLHPEINRFLSESEEKGRNFQKVTTSKGKELIFLIAKRELIEYF